MDILLNVLIVLCTAGSIALHLKKSTFGKVMRYFTSLSNVFCAAAALAVAICRLLGTVPQPVLLLKYIGTAAVTVTLLTVMLFLGRLYGYKPLLTGPDFFLHLFCPVLAIVSFSVWERPEIKSGSLILGVLPVLVYGSVYLYKVVFTEEEKRWEDFYSFNRDGKWYISCALMLLGSLCISALLWWIP